jgi:HAD superfamily phosphoserine phosphatase-like hydrolase
LHQYSYSLFDFDNTLYKGQTRYLILDFSSYLNANNIFNSIDFLRLHHSFNSYLEAQFDRTHFAIEIVQAYYHGLRGHQTKEIDDFALKYWNILNINGWFTYTDPLLDLIKKHTLPILISGSPLEVLKHSGKLSDFKSIYGSKGIVREGIYTGQMDFEMATEAAKTQMVAELVKSINIDPQFSFAFGDSVNDFPMLKAVNPKNAYLLGANDMLVKEISDKNWNCLEQDLKIIDHVQKRINLLYP